MEKIILPSKKFALASESDVYLNIELNQNNALLPINNFEKIVSNYEIYLKERSDSFKYRIYGNLSLIASNVLCELDGEYGYEGVETVRNFDQLTQKYQYSVEDVLFNDDGWYYYIDPSNFCLKTELEPQKTRFNLTNTDNWKISITYPAKKDVNTLFFNSININDGIAIMGGGESEVDGKQLTFMVCPLNHNLTIGDTINVYNSSGFVKKCVVYKMGLNDNTYKKNVFFVDEKLDFSSNFLPESYRFKKVIGDFESQYYSRWYSKLDSMDYDVFKTSFCKNVFTDLNYTFVFPTTTDLTGIVDHLNRPLSELYISMIKNTDNIFWGNTLCAIDTLLSNINYDFNMVYEGGFLSPVEIITTTQDYYFGNIVEYNEKTLLETELNHALHVFNSKDRLLNNLPESYYYNPHYRVEIKTFSDHIIKEDGVLVVPDYATKINNLYQWRELFQAEIPYLNQHHYAYLNQNIFIRRQDPCKRYDIGDNALIEGKCLNVETDKIINIEKIC